MTLLPTNTVGEILIHAILSKVFLSWQISFQQTAIDNALVKNIVQSHEATMNKQKYVHNCGYCNSTYISMHLYFYFIQLIYK